MPKIVILVPPSAAAVADALACAREDENCIAHLKRGLNYAAKKLDARAKAFAKHVCVRVCVCVFACMRVCAFVRACVHWCWCCTCFVFSINVLPDVFRACFCVYFISLSPFLCELAHPIHNLVCFFAICICACVLYCYMAAAQPGCACVPLILFSKLSVCAVLLYAIVFVAETQAHTSKCVSLGLAGDGCQCHACNGGRIRGDPACHAGCIEGTGGSVGFINVFRADPAMPRWMHRGHRWVCEVVLLIVWP